MKYIKINNFWNQFNQPDYKGLDIDKFIAGSQRCNLFITYSVCATNEELTSLLIDVEEITEEQYKIETQNIQNINQQPSQNEVLAQTVANLTLQNADLASQLETLSQTIAQMQLG